MNRHCFLILLILLITGFQPVRSQSSTVYRDHRKKPATGNNATTISVPTIVERNFFPASLGRFPVLRKCESREITFMDLLSTAPLSKVALAANVRLDNGWSSGITQEPFELLLLADSLFITGPVFIDLSRNRTNSNGYLGIICRHIVFKNDNASLTVQLGATETYRKFFLMTEDVWANDKKVMVADSILQQRVMVSPKQRSAAMPGAMQFEVSSVLAGTATAYKPVREIKTYRDISRAIGPVAVFNDLFSKWVLDMYTAVYHHLVNADLKDDYTFAQTYLSINSMPPYEISGNVSDSIALIRNQLARMLRSRFKNGNIFSTRVAAGSGYVNMISEFEGTRIKNFMFPDKASVAASGSDTLPSLGYMLMTDPAQKEFILEMEVELGNDPAKSIPLIQQFKKQNRTVEDFSGQVQLNELRLTGTDLNIGKCSVTPVVGNLYRVHLVASTGPSNLFYKLFTGANTDIFISGEYLKIPLKIPLILNQAVFAGRRSLLKLDPAEFGRYFEQIDGSDDMLQRFSIFNNIGAIPKDSLSGPLQYVEVMIKYNDGIKDLIKQVRLAPAQSLGDQAVFDIFKLKKQYIPVSLKGQAVYENGTYQLTERSTTDGEMTLNLTAAMLK